MYQGREPWVVLSNYTTAKKVFGDDVSAGRCPGTAIRVDTATGKESGLLYSTGDLWKVQRRFALSALRDLGMGKNWMEDTIIAEVGDLMQVLTNSHQAPFNAKAQLMNSISNVICALIFGERFSLSDPKFTRMTHMLTEHLDSQEWETMATVFPFLMYFPNSIRTRMLRARRNLYRLAAFFKERVDAHAEGGHHDEGAPDYINAYHAESEAGSKTAAKDTFDEPQLLASMFDLFAAGTETTSTTTLWFMVFMVENPDVMKKVQDEIDNNVGRDRMLLNSDRPLLPYTEAMILEVQRCANLVPLALPHRAREDMTIDGYTIPKDTVLIPNLFSMHQDPRWWTEPEKFDPTRFLDANMKVIKPDGFAPFSLGKRACLGEALAKMELFLIFANMLRCFTLKVPPGKTVSSQNYLSSLVNGPRPFELIFVPRS